MLTERLMTFRGASGVAAGTIVPRGSAEVAAMAGLTPSAETARTRTK